MEGWDGKLKVAWTIVTKTHSQKFLRGETSFEYEFSSQTGEEFAESNPSEGANETHWMLFVGKWISHKNKAKEIQ